MIYKTLHQFYTSTEWRKLRKVIIAERTNKKDGILYDEYSGKPLLKDYDISLHHKIHLTLQNVNDPSISLNPDNIMVVSIKSHNALHKRFGSRPSLSDRKVYYVYGAPLAGKSTFVRENMAEGDLVLDIDRLWVAVSGQPEYVKPHELKPVVFNLRNAVLDAIKTRAGDWQAAWVIEGGARLGERMRRIEELGAEPIHIDTSREECLMRLERDESREAVREQWRGFIDKWFDEYQPDKE